MSQTVHEAGGIGGLLACVETAGTYQGSYWYFYDGNGNVGQVIKASDSSTVAKYEYDPYGNLIYSSGTYASSNPFRFSTKWLDSEIDYPNTTLDGLYYFGYRYYSPRLGRWINRDPIGEKDGSNLYGSLFNNPANYVEPMGLFPWTPIGICVGTACTYYATGCNVGSLQTAYETRPCSVCCPVYQDPTACRTDDPCNNIWGQEMYSRQEICQRNVIGRGTWYPVPGPGGGWKLVTPCDARCK